MLERTSHGQQRHAQADRPTQEAFRDRKNPRETYHDLDTCNWVFIGPRGRTHIFLPNGKHHTSFRTTKRARQGKR